MTNTETLCMGCMTDKGNSLVCHYCSSEQTKQRNAVALPLRTILHKRFLIGNVLGEPGGFGITYLAWDLLLDTTAAIKEFLPLSSVSRDTDNSTVRVNSKKDQDYFNKGLRIFLKEAKILAQFSHPNIVRIRDCFTSNNTAYLVMEYHKGLPLDQYIKNSGGKLDEKKSLAIMLPIMDGLNAVHKQNFLHRDVKPQNIYITNKGTPLLLDFGASRVALANTEQTMTVMLSGGFAPFEQYHEKGKQGPWGDIYSVGATLYFMVTGKKPNNAIERQHNDNLHPPISYNSALSESFNLAIMHAMSINPIERPQNILSFKQLLTSPNTPPSLALNTSEPAVFNITDIPAANPAIKKHKPAAKITYDGNKTDRNINRYLICIVLAIVLWSSWNTRQLLMDNNNQDTLVNPLVLEEAETVLLNNNLLEPLPNKITTEVSTQFEIEPQLIETLLIEPKKQRIVNKPNTAIFKMPEAIQVETPKIVQKQETAATSFRTEPKNNTATFSRPRPPQIAFSICQNKKNHSSCQFNSPRGKVRGTCLQERSKQLVCIPKDAPRPRNR